MDPGERDTYAHVFAGTIQLLAPMIITNMVSAALRCWTWLSIVA